MDAEPPEWWHGAAGDVRPRHRTLLQGGGLHTDGEGHEDTGHSTGYGRLFSRTKTNLIRTVVIERYANAVMQADNGASVLFSIGCNENT